MTLFSRIVLLVTILGAAGGQVLAAIEKSYICESLLSTTVSLSREQVFALKRARAVGMDITVLKKRINGRDRVVVILGESHRQSRAQFDAGRDVLESFEHHGVEGVANEGYWLSKSLYNLIEDRVASQVGAMSVEPSKATLGGRYEIPQNKTQMRGSLIDQSTLNDAFESLESQLVSRLVLLVQSGEMSFDQIVQKIRNHWFTANAYVQQGQDAQFIRAFVDYLNEDRLIESVRAQLESSVVRSGGVPETGDSSGAKLLGSRANVNRYQLEEGYRLGLHEKIAGVGVVLGEKLSSKTCTAVGACMAVASMLVPIDLREPVWNVGVTLVGAQLSVAVMKMLSWGYFKSIEKRNAYMRASIRSVFENNPDLEDLLVIVGSNHSFDLMKQMILKEIYSISEIK